MKRSKTRSPGIDRTDASRTPSSIPADECESQSAEMRAYLEQMPKAEVHLHLEGSISPETIVELTRRNGIDYFNTVEEIEQSLANRPPGLEGFLEHHFKVQDVILTRKDFYDAIYALIEKLHQNNVVCADISFDPQAHTSRGIEFADMFEGIDAGRRDAEEALGVTTNLIMCIQRERSVESALEMLDQARPYRDRIIGVGMDSGPEYGNPPIKFRDVFERARNEGYLLTGHHDVDVRDSIKHIRQSIDIIRLDRIDHGLNATDDPQLMAELAERGICLTGSPVKRSTDPKLQDVDRITALDQAGVFISVNSDDPAQFETGYLSNMLVMFQEESGYSKEDMTRLMLNAYRALFVPQDQKDAYIEKLKDYAVEQGVDWADVTRGR